MFNFLFTLISILTTIPFIILFIDTISKIWILPVVFISTYLICIILFLLFNFFVTLPVSKKKECNKYNKFFHKLLSYDAEYLCFLFNIKIKVTGLEKMPKNTNFMLIQNHKSFFDPLITLFLLEKYHLSFISKTENFDKFIVGKLMVKNGYIPLKRDDNRDAVKSVLRAVNQLKSKEFSVCVYPEGSRNQNEGLLPFKPGCFKISQKANVPIVISVLEGTEDVKKSFIFKRKVVNLKILEVIDPNNFKNTEEISSHCENVMKNEIANYENKLNKNINK